MRIKCVFDEDIRRLSICGSVSMEKLEAEIRQRYELKDECLWMGWTDSDGDLVTLDSDEDLMEASYAIGEGLLRMTLRVSVSSGRTAHRGSTAELPSSQAANATDANAPADKIESAAHSIEAQC